MSEIFSQGKSICFPTDYNSIMERIGQFNPAQYGRSRNFVHGAVSYLSPYISRGVVSVKQIHDSVLASGYGSMAEKFLQELAWREYFQRVWQVKGENIFDDIRQPQRDVIHHQMIKSIEAATSGITAIDESILEFYRTGYMHNHVRMYLASITCNIGRAHWREPSRWMYYHLLDGDLASNSCSWQWVAGTFSSKKYYCNQVNINLHTRTQQHNTFLDVPAESLHHVQVPGTLRSTCALALKTNLPAKRAPFIDTRKPALIYNAYNLDPHWRKNEDVNRILLLEPSHFQKYPVSDKVIDFIISLSHNIPGCQLMIGEITDLVKCYEDVTHAGRMLVSKEHPAFAHYPGLRDERDWIYGNVSGYFNSFHAFWKQCKKLH